MKRPVWFGTIFLILALSSFTSACSNPSESTKIVPATAEEKEYAAWFEGALEAINAADVRLQEALDDYREDPEDDYAVLIIAREVMNFSMIAEEAASHSAPSSLNDVHTAFTSGLQEYQIFSDMMQGKSEEDKSTLFTHLTVGEALILQSGSKYDKWKQQREPF